MRTIEQKKKEQENKRTRKQENMGTREKISREQENN